MKRIWALLLCTALVLSLTVPTLATGVQTEQETAAAWLKEKGILTGDQNGNLNLGSGLRRAELAVILTRLSDKTGDMGRNSAYYRTICPFTDVPEWAMPYAGYCAEKKLMAGYGNKLFGPNDPVTPAAACTVMLRYLDCPASQWNYSTACDKASELELLQQIEEDWPTGTVWGTWNTPDTNKNEVPCTVARRIMDTYWVSEYYGCSGYASMISSLIFGDKVNAGRKLENLSQIRPGDIIFRVNNTTGKVWHITVALESPSSIHAFHFTDGNAGEIVRWPDPENPYGRDNLDSYRGEGKNYHLEVWTRYPESVPYTGNSVMGWPTGT